MSQRIDPTADRLVMAPGVVLPASAVQFTLVASSGPGGQNVNKVATKACMTVTLEALSEHMPAAAVGRLKTIAGHHLVGQDRIAIQADESRSALSNREACLVKLRRLIQQAMRRPKVRKPTRPSAGSVKRRIEGKKQRGQIKQGRQANRRGDW